MTNIAQFKPGNQPSTNTAALIFNPDALGQMQNLAILMAEGRSTLPKHLQDAPADCMAIIMQAVQWQMNPYAVAQKTHLVSGTLGYEAQLVNAVISSSQAIEGRFHYKYGGSWSVSGGGTEQVQANKPGVNVNIGTTITVDSWVQCGAILRGEKDITWGEPLFPATITTKNSPLWKTNPKQQSAYLALKYWSRLYTPAVILGVYTPDELVEDSREEKEINTSHHASTASSTLNSLIDEVDADASPAAATVAPCVDADGVEAPEITMTHYLDNLDNAKTLENLKLVFTQAWSWAKEHKHNAAAAEFKATYDARLLEF